jgi:hypothetical protein
MDRFDWFLFAAATYVAVMALVRLLLLRRDERLREMRTVGSRRVTERLEGQAEPSASGRGEAEFPDDGRPLSHEEAA